MIIGQWKIYISFHIALRLDIWNDGLAVHLCWKPVLELVLLLPGFWNLLEVIFVSDITEHSLPLSFLFSHSFSIFKQPSLEDAGHMTSVLLQKCSYLNRVGLWLFCDRMPMLEGRSTNLNKLAQFKCLCKPLMPGCAANRCLVSQFTVFQVSHALAGFWILFHSDILIDRQSFIFNCIFLFCFLILDTPRMFCFVFYISKSSRFASKGQILSFACDSLGVMNLWQYNNLNKFFAYSFLEFLLSMDL